MKPELIRLGHIYDQLQKEFCERELEDANPYFDRVIAQVEAQAQLFQQINQEAQLLEAAQQTGSYLSPVVSSRVERYTDHFPLPFLELMENRLKFIHLFREQLERKKKPTTGDLDGVNKQRVAVAELVLNLSELLDFDYTGVDILQFDFYRYVKRVQEFVAPDEDSRRVIEDLVKVVHETAQDHVRFQRGELRPLREEELNLLRQATLQLAQVEELINGLPNPEKNTERLSALQKLDLEKIRLLILELEPTTEWIIDIRSSLYPHKRK